MSWKQYFFLMDHVGFVVLTLSFLALVKGVQPGPLCLNYSPPFEQEAGLSFCSQYSTTGCCRKQDDDVLRDYYYLMEAISHETLWANCSSYAKAFLCQKCSPYAWQIHGGETEPPRDFPGLCSGYCEEFFRECRYLVAPYMRIITGGQSTREINKMQNGFITGSKAFCDAVKLPTEEYCYKGLDFHYSGPAITTPLPPAVTVQQPETERDTTISQVASSSQPNISGGVSPDTVQNVGGCLCLEEIASDLRLPVSLVHANDGSNRIFVAELYGIVNIFYPNGIKLAEPFIDIRHRIGPLPKVSEEGIGDIAFHPNFKSNGLFYILFSTPEKTNGVDHHSNLAEFRISSEDINKADPDYFRLLLKIPEPHWPHNAEKLLFGVDNFLYIFTGDGGGFVQDPENYAQDMKRYNGKILRIDVDSRTGDLPYGIPPDNPFLGPLSDGPYALPEIYGLGFRNPWNCGVDPGDGNTGYGRGRMICGDVGQDSEEELNLIERGGNYGWNVKEGTQENCQDCKLAPLADGNLVEPIFSYRRESRLGKAVIGGEFYRGCLYPQLNGLFLWGDHYSGRLFRLFENETGGWENTEVEMCDTTVCTAPLTDSYAPKIISFGRDENGEVYMLSVKLTDPLKESGHVYRFVDPFAQQDPDICKTKSSITAPTAAIMSPTTPKSVVFNEIFRSKDPASNSVPQMYNLYLLELLEMSNKKPIETGTSQEDATGETTLLETTNSPLVTASSTVSTGEGTVIVPGTDVLTQTGQTTLEKLVQELLADDAIVKLLNDKTLSGIVGELLNLPNGEKISKKVLNDINFEKFVTDFLAGTGLNQVITAFFNDSLLENPDADEVITDFLNKLSEQSIIEDILKEQNTETVNRDLLSDSALVDSSLTEFILSKPNHEDIVGMLLGYTSPLSVIVKLLKEPKTEAAIADFLEGPYFSKLIAYLLSNSTTMNFLSTIPEELLPYLQNDPNVGKLIGEIRDGTNEGTESTNLPKEVINSEIGRLKQFLLSEPGHEKLAERLLNSSNPLSVIIKLLNESKTETAISEFLEGPYLSKLIYFLLSHSRIKNAFSDALAESGSEKLLPYLQNVPTISELMGEILNGTYKGTDSPNPPEEPLIENEIVSPNAKQIDKPSQKLQNGHDTTKKDVTPFQPKNDITTLKPREEISSGNKMSFITFLNNVVKDKTISTQSEQLISEINVVSQLTAQNKLEFREFLLTEKDPTKVINGILELTNPLNLVAELIQDARIRTVLGDLLSGHYAEKLVRALLKNVSPEQVIKDFKDEPSTIQVFEFLLKASRIRAVVVDFLTEAYFESISEVILPNVPKPNEVTAASYSAEKEKIIKFLQNEADRVERIRVLFNLKNPLKRIADLLYDPVVGKEVADLLQENYGKTMMASLLRKEPNPKQVIKELLHEHRGKKMITHLLKNPYTQKDATNLIINLYEDVLQEKLPEQLYERASAERHNTLGASRNIALLLNDGVLIRLAQDLLGMGVPTMATSFTSTSSTNKNTPGTGTGTSVFWHGVSKPKSCK